MHTSSGIFGLAIAGVVFTVLCVVANCFLPPLILEWWIRDADVGLWFCGGLLLTELSLPGWLSYFRIGNYSTRLFVGSVFCLICIVSAWGGFLMTGPADQADAIAFLAGVFVPTAVLVGVDLFAVRSSSCRLVHRVEDSDVNEPVDPGTAEWSFGLANLFGWVILVAIAAGLWSSALRMNAIAYRDVRFYLSDSMYYNVAKLGWFVMLHLGIIYGTLSRDNRWVLAWLIPGVILGLEMMRRLQFYSTGTMPIYLEWDFAMLSLGFVAGHGMLGLGLRFLGWSLRCS
ncbi:MAG: hypothetical protein ACK553_03115 [Planctomycetota bacterium]